MKNTFKNVVAILLTFALFIGFASAFPKMDVCNYTNWDKSGNYYDWLCAKNWKKTETGSQINYIIQNVVPEKKEEKNSELKHVKHYNGSSAIFWTFNSRSGNEIKKLKETISKQNELIKKIELENSKLLKNQNILLENIKQKEIIIKKVINKISVNKNNINYTKKKSYYKGNDVLWEKTEYELNENRRLIREKILNRNKKIK